jgi:hypothetical protein
MGDRDERADEELRELEALRAMLREETARASAIRQALHETWARTDEIRASIVDFRPARLFRSGR